MSWVDIVAAVIVIVIAVIESNRGFGLALFDMVGGILSVKLAEELAPTAAKAMPVGSSPNGAEAFWLAALFVVLIGLTLLASKLLYQTTLLSLDTMDPIIGGIIGIANGIMVSYVVLTAMMLTSKGQPFGDTLAVTAAYQQLVEFQGFNYMMDACRSLGD